ncbi:hypothetical protein SPHINGO391_510034 [Sphingomonas aurantiaca]|uniref:Uncharacterized protein n=1 Tax=Sphingomonas aurantiaca TaxID=185949 RepID=A0A5E8ADH3_9SPHN|nr:hypothetical protein SPHINGO391_510034 [Sphingomonas aurantiaca]
MTNSTAERSVDMLLRDADRAQRAGDRASATAAFEAILSRKPDHPVALNAVGMAALGHDDRRAATYFARAAAADPTAAPLWMNLASAHRGLGDADAERAALERALALDQRNLMANVRIAELFERTADMSAAAFSLGWRRNGHPGDARPPARARPVAGARDGPDRGAEPSAVRRCRYGDAAAAHRRGGGAASSVRCVYRCHAGSPEDLCPRAARAALSIPARRRILRARPFRLARATRSRDACDPGGTANAAGGHCAGFHPLCHDDAGDAAQFVECARSLGGLERPVSLALRRAERPAMCPVPANRGDPR